MRDVTGRRVGVEEDIGRAQQLVKKFSMEYMEHEKMRLEVVTAA